MSLETFLILLDIGYKISFIFYPIIGIILVVFIKPIYSWVKEISKLPNEIKEIKKWIKNLDPSWSYSPKNITDIGKEVLAKVNIEEFLNTCELLQPDSIEDLQKKEELDIFIACYNWVKEKKEDTDKKIMEILYNSNFSKEKCIELLALAIRDKILENKKNN